jgi:hypothetical protein
MPCIQIVASDGSVIGHVCRPSGETKQVPGRRRKRWWCFNCRKRDMHTLMGFYPSGLSYYGPTYWWECPRCHGEHVLFPGREWTDDE